MTALKTWLKRPYPFNGQLTDHLRSAGWSMLFVSLFLVIFQPFGISFPAGHFWDGVLGCSFFGLVSAVTLFITGLMMMAFPKYFNEKNWTVGREIISTLGVTMLVGLANMQLANFLWDQKWSWEAIIYWQWVTFLVGLIFGFTNAFIKQKRFVERHTAGAEKLNSQLKAPSEKSAVTITISGDNQDESLTLSAADILYLEAADNYVNVFYLKNENLESSLLRSTLKKMETQLSAHPNLFRCHRTYLVNLDRVLHVSGNAQGYKLHLDGTEILVPVSRSLNGEINQRLT